MQHLEAVDKIAGVFKKKFSVRNLTIIDSSSELKDDLGLDSLDRLEFIFHVEDAFDVVVPDGEIEQFKTIGDIANFITAHVD